MLHLIKLSVGSKDVAGLQAWQAERALTHPPLRHRTRNRPKRRDDLLDGGSIYWVIAGFIQARQRIVDLIDDTMEDGSACVGIVLDPLLVPVAARAMKAFQGWRYLEPDAAPPDLADHSTAPGIEGLPPALRAALREARLI
ncbi:DUF1489 family protein [Roseococcus pinisoli]|uniref:DUF1489 domain-containing protein n=1 Tax=Roseococcus pinisoli TaxID=2835040 RepID=A0ABS5QIM5_9PROT|nr:DUF1489 domain-containing protein [Roseococcus pinisoli]MBS7813539.1 DUF1489 domain-containing protein [Roseococcus pinisoli]